MKPCFSANVGCFDIQTWCNCGRWQTVSRACTITTHVKCLHNTTTVLRPFFRDHPGQLVPEENFWTLWCKGRVTQADTLTIQLGATPSGITSAHLHHLPIFFTGRMPFLSPNQQHQRTEALYNMCVQCYNNDVNKTNECESTRWLMDGQSVIPIWQFNCDDP